MSAAIAPLPLEVLLTLVNRWGTEPRRAADESDDPYPPSLGGIAGIDDAAAVDAADRLHEVFAASTGGQRADLLNALVERTGLRSHLVADDWRLRDEWSADRPDAALLAAGTLTRLHLVTGAADSSRLGICGGDDCVDAYVDRSPGGRRRYCSLTCQTRARTRHHRGRTRSEPPG